MQYNKDLCKYALKQYNKALKSALSKATFETFDKTKIGRVKFKYRNLNLLILIKSSLFDNLTKEKCM